MNDYISREALAERLGRNLAACNPRTFSERCYADAIETVKHFPTADVEPVRHGKWRNNRSHYPECTECGYMPMYDPSIDDIYYSPYCPNCGAKMDLEARHEAD